MNIIRCHSILGWQRAGCKFQQKLQYFAKMQNVATTSSSPRKNWCEHNLYSLLTINTSFKTFRLLTAEKWLADLPFLSFLCDNNLWEENEQLTRVFFKKTGSCRSKGRKWNVHFRTSVGDVSSSTRISNEA